MTQPRPTALLVGGALLADGDAWAVGAAVLDLVRQARAAGIPVVLAGASGDDAGAGEFDAVADPAVIGAAKPSRDFFAAACALVATSPRACLLVDAADRDVRGARAAGLRALRCTDPADLDYVRAALGQPS